MITKFKKIYPFSSVGVCEFKEVPAVEVDLENFRFAKKFLGMTTMFFGEVDIPHSPEFAITVEADGWVSLWYLHNTARPVVTNLCQLKQARQLEGWWEAEIEQLAGVEDSYGCVLDSAYHIKVVAGRDSEEVLDIAITYPGTVGEPIFIKD